jgi:hypothetical protein
MLRNRPTRGYDDGEIVKDVIGKMDMTGCVDP